ncbi:TPA: hypothetical protein DF272_03415 [Candidatus Falkowbacteria bacterium]|nr:hypothetical protein [Candidatus Falkowbacteria bacterium]
MKYLDELEKLNLPVGQYAIFGSGPLAARAIRASADLDVIVKAGLWTDLTKKYVGLIQGDPECLKIGLIEIYKDWLMLTNKIDQMVDSAEVIDGFPYVRLEYVIEWKQQMGRDKDKHDLKLIKQYQNNIKSR